MFNKTKGPWQPKGKMLDFDVHVDKLLDGAKKRNEAEYNSWYSVIDTYTNEIESLRKQVRQLQSN